MYIKSFVCLSMLSLYDSYFNVHIETKKKKGTCTIYAYICPIEKTDKWKGNSFYNKTSH